MRGWPYNYWDREYRRNQYQKIYDKKNGYNPNNKWSKYNGWGFQTGDIAPKFDPNSHFESPYYDYDSYHNYGDSEYWNRMKNGPYTNDGGDDSKTD